MRCSTSTAIRHATKALLLFKESGVWCTAPGLLKEHRESTHQGQGCWRGCRSLPWRQSKCAEQLAKAPVMGTYWCLQSHPTHGQKSSRDRHAT